MSTRVRERSQVRRAEPGGAGPMTRAMLLASVAEAAEAAVHQGTSTADPAAPWAGRITRFPLHAHASDGVCGFAPSAKRLSPHSISGNDPAHRRVTMNRFEGKTAIITGGTKGLGLAFAHRLGAEGAKVLITARTESDLERAVKKLTAEGIDAFSVATDMASPTVGTDITDAAMERWGQIDVLVNNAGLFDEADFLDIELDRWRYVIDAMLTGPFLLAQAAARHMVKARKGSIINIASIDAHAADGPYTSYGAAKAGLLTMTKYIAVALGPHNVRCNSISPGWVDTPMIADAVSQEMRDRMRTGFTRVPLRRLLTVEELAAACAFLASDEASGVTGIDLMVDGGTMADAHIIPVADNLLKLAEIDGA
jgi:NAD(P)-dependent dehydrogenase (short-subunit alcohol dehydrogenase family)